MFNIAILVNRLEIEIRSRKLKAALENDPLCVKRFGKQMAHYIRLRMDALDAALNLFDFWPPKSKPERIHELSGKKAGLFSIDVKQPYRIIFRPIYELKKDFQNEKERWLSIQKIEILGIEDTHG